MIRTTLNTFRKWYAPFTTRVSQARQRDAVQRADPAPPPEWSADLYARLTALDKEVEYFTYPDQPHTFVDEGHALLIERAIAFFDQHLRRPK